MLSASAGSKCTINISAEITVLKYTDDSLMTVSCHSLDKYMAVVAHHDHGITCNVLATLFVFWFQIYTFYTPNKFLDMGQYNKILISLEYHNTFALTVYANLSNQ